MKKVSEDEVWTVAFRVAWILIIVYLLVSIFAKVGWYVINDYNYASCLSQKIKAQQACLNYANYSDISTVEDSTICFSVIQTSKQFSCENKND